MSVISQPTNAVVEPSFITKIRKYKRFHEGHHFILMAMKMHDILGRDIDFFIRECACLFHDKRLGGHLSFSFCIQFSKQCVSITLQYALTPGIERKIMLMDDVCFRPIITIRCHNLHGSDIRGAMGEIASYHERD